MYNIADMKNTAMIRAVVVFLLILFISGCSGIRYGTIRYIDPNANFSYIKKVAVLPFGNMSSDRYAGEKIRSTLMADLLSRRVFDVIEHGEVMKVVRLVLRGAGAEEGGAIELDKETLKLLGDKLGAQAVILGSVEDYGDAITISIRMLDIGSGTILWQVRTTATGKQVWRKILGVENIDKSILTRIAVKKALDTLL